MFLVKIAYYSLNFRSCHRRSCIKKGVHKYFVKLTWKYLCRSLSFNRVTGLRPATLLKKRHQHSCFRMKAFKIFKTSYFAEHLQVISSASSLLKEVNNFHVVKILVVTTELHNNKEYYIEDSNFNITFLWHCIFSVFFGFHYFLFTKTQ